MPSPLWTPSPERVRDARLTHFRLRAADVAGAPLPDYDALWAWSVAEPAAFWDLWANESGLRFTTRTDEVLVGETMRDARWFPGSTLNFAENLLRFEGSAPAVIAADEAGRDVVLSRDELRAQVGRVQAWLRAQGVGRGDRVAAWMPNREEAVVTMLAATGLGAIWSSSSPDFGVRGVLDRVGQIQPKVLLAANGARYAGKAHSMVAKVLELQQALGCAVLMVDVLGDGVVTAGATPWSEVMAAPEASLHFEPVPFDHPAYILYSSGTTGVPKCIVHGVGGTLLQHTKELALHTNLGDGDVLFFYTTTGWMMWNWLVSGLAVGAAIVLWDGSPNHPDLNVLWRLAERHNVTAFGTSPRFLAMCEQAAASPGYSHDLSALRTLLSTGSPLAAEQFRWVYDHVGRDIQLASICGGTDIISCFMLGSPVDPVWAGEIQKRGLGMAVQAWSADGEPLTDVKGELVCTAPFPSMPTGFWNDPGNQRYHRAYFDHFPGIWRHGDWITLTQHGGVIVHGRSDATLNPGGVRIGSAEIYGPVESLPEIADSVVVGWPVGDDVEIVLFVVLRPEASLDEALVSRLRARIREQASPRHVPAKILAAPAIPRTISGKKVEIAVLQALRGEPVPNRDAMADPTALDWFATVQLQAPSPR